MGRLSLIIVAMQAFFIVLNSSLPNDLKLGFYGESCPNAENIIANFVEEHITSGPSMAAPLLRLHFHDCFVRGCDASVLIDSTSTNQAEKSSPPNWTLRGFQFIDRVKALLEKECPGVVSCADILALVARDVVNAIGGPSWEVEKGRRGLVSNASEALSNLPSFQANFSTLLNLFGANGLNLTDLVLLSGAHTIGVAHCSTISSRLYDISGNVEDPSIDKNYAAQLKANKCRVSDDNTTLVEMDPGSYTTFDLGYYKQLLKRRALFRSDDALTTDKDASLIVERLVSSPLETFFGEFAVSMTKMSRVGVLTGNEGPPRAINILSWNCRELRNPSPIQQLKDW